MSRILIVDDSEITRGIIRDVLSSAGHDVVGEARNGREALDEYKRLMPDLVTMDILMPNVNGIQALKSIQEFDPDAMVVMCSSIDQQSMVMDAIAAGAKEFIIKPIDAKILLDIVNKVLQSRKRR